MGDNEPAEGKDKQKKVEERENNQEEEMEVIGGSIRGTNR